MSRNAVNRRLVTALELDNSLVISKELLGTHPGFSLEHMQSVGLRKSDLKFLEAHGCSRRGYIRVTRAGKIYTGTETNVRWVLIGNSA